jgi:hypothetical protein
MGKLKPTGLDSELLNETFEVVDRAALVMRFRRRPRSHFPEGREGDRTWSMWNSKYAGRLAGVPGTDGRVRVAFAGKTYDARCLVEEIADGGTSSGTPETGGTSENGEADEFGYTSEEIGDGPLGRVIRDEAVTNHCALADLTAMRRDPYRRDTPSGHRNGEWFKQWWERYGRPRGLHLRGLFYALIMHQNEDGSVGVRKPNGANLINTEDDYNWLGDMSQDARWLGYVAFEEIPDERNAEPMVRKYAERDEAEAQVAVIALDRTGLDPDAIGVFPSAANFDARQPYRLVLFGEKTSLAAILDPIAEEYQADLYLETGQISDRHLYEIAKDGWVDGRRLVMITVSDFDPAGYWDMPIAIARKLQAHRDREFDSLEFTMIPAALNERQVRAAPPLPSTPLKRVGEPGRERMLPGADRVHEWLRAYGGLEQTEVDAAIALKPNDLSRWVREALDPWFERGLAARVEAAKAEWLERAQSALAEHVDQTKVERLKVKARLAYASLMWVNENLQEMRATAAAGADLPEPEVPEPDQEALEAAQAEQAARGGVLVNSDMGFAEATRRLRAYAPGREKLRRWKPKPRRDADGRDHG